MKLHTKPLNNITLPMPINAAVVQDEANTILERDPHFEGNCRQLRDNYTSGVLPTGVFKNILRWQVAATLRRAKLPLRTARQYQSMTLAGVGFYS